MSLRIRSALRIAVNRACGFRSFRDIAGIGEDFHQSRSLCPYTFYTEELRARRRIADPPIAATSDPRRMPNFAVESSS